MAQTQLASGNRTNSDAPRNQGAGTPSVVIPGEGRARAMIEGVQPEIDAGRFPIKRVVGETVHVEADVFGDGHDAVTAVLQYRAEGDSWQEVPMEPLVNDRWQAEFSVDRTGRWYYTVVAWVDRFLTWHHDLKKRVAADQVSAVDLAIGAELVEAAAERAAGDDAQQLKHWGRILRDQQSLAQAADISVDPVLESLMLRYADRQLATNYARELQVTVDRERARFSSWYELFPRSASEQRDRHGTLRDVQARLPYIASMQFDVLYLPPIHPIGTAFRKGKNNTTEANADDVGSPWGIGTREGGHKAIHPELGTMEDFQSLLRAAQDQGIEIALDIAFQCSPDHPYVRTHPQWFRKRPDGSIQYAENPPKKYQDIYPFDFETEDWQALWIELKSIFEFWIEHGVKIFRVDNPHTKSFAFWEWCIGEIKRRDPDVLFLSEAFTRPKVMYRLAKLGFTQSYTYFTWRNTKQELTEYLQELTQTEVREFFRPNFWPNTPDILPASLQIGKRSAFMSRLVLAATLSSNYGIYGPPFEHGWSAPLKPGSEEYLNSEKYQLHYHDLSRPDSLQEFIARINRIRRENPVLQSNSSLRFHDVDNADLICYSKTLPDQTQTIVTVVNLDPHYKQSGFVELPLVELGLDPQHPYQVHDLLSDRRFLWHGSRNYVELDPGEIPAHVFRVRRHMPSEQDFETFS